MRPWPFIKNEWSTDSMNISCGSCNTTAAPVHRCSVDFSDVSLPLVFSWFRQRFSPDFSSTLDKLRQFSKYYVNVLWKPVNISAFGRGRLPLSFLTAFWQGSVWPSVFQSDLLLRITQSTVSVHYNIPSTLVVAWEPVWVGWWNYLINLPHVIFTLLAYPT